MKPQRLSGWARRAPVGALACAAALVACGTHAVGAPPSAPATAAARSVPDGDWATFNYTSQRYGVGPARTGITAGNARKLGRRIVHLPGTVDSAPIQLHAIGIGGRVRDVVIVTTSYGRTLAIDPGTGARLWEFAPSDISHYQGSYRITNASPTADPDRRHVYASSPDGQIHKLDVANGRQLWATRVTYEPTHEKLASPPTISGGSLIVVTDGYIGDAPPYQGHVVTIDRASGRILHVWNSLCSDRHQLIVPRTCGASDSAIWGRAGAVVEPRSRRILVATGNGPFNGHTNWGDSTLELSPDASRLLRHWTPRNQGSLNASDGDIGSTSPVLLPDPGGPPLAVQGGKDGVLKLLNLDRLSRASGAAGRRLGGEIQRISAPGGAQMFAAPAVWVHRGRTYLFVADERGMNAYVLHAGRHPRLSRAWSRGSPGTSPVLAGGLLYVYDQINARLNVLSPTSGRGFASLPAGSGHWNSPIVVGGRVILPLGNANDHASHGTLIIYYLRRR